jgi:membrane-associated phospholipid phosphatase
LKKRSSLKFDLEDGIFCLPSFFIYFIQIMTEPRPTRRFRTFIFQVYLVGAVVLFAVLAFLASNDDHFQIDLVITRAVQSFDHPWFSVLMHAISWPGNAPYPIFIILGVGILFYLSGLSWEGLMAVIAGGGVQAVNLALKIIIGRPRPADDLVSIILEATGYSFPSGHVMFYSGFFGFLIFLLFTLFKTSPLRLLSIGFLALLIILVGPSRIFLGVHWASDVLAAYLLGSVSLGAIVLVYRWGKPRVFPDQPVAPP